MPELLKAQARIDSNIAKASERSTAPSKEQQPFNVKAATKAQLIDYAEKEGIEIDASAKVGDIRKVISEA